MNLKECPY